MIEHYLDNAATTRVCDSAFEAMKEMLLENYGNPSSLHAKGYEAEKAMERAKQTIADILSVEPKELYLTSCATEGTNTFLSGIAEHLSHQGKHILSSKTEHSATRETLKRLAIQGFEIEYINNDSTGKISVEDLKAKIRPDTILVTCLHVNNEIGVINPIEEMGKAIKEENAKTIFFVDAVQSFGKLEVKPRKMLIDGLTISAHKCNGPKGTGILYVKDKVFCKPLIVGGGQEKGLRSGTQNTAGLVASAVAAKELYDLRLPLAEKWQSFKQLLLNQTEDLGDVFVNGPSVEEAAPHIINLRFENIRSEVLLHALEGDGIYVSSGSACSSNKPEEKSPTLASIGLNAQQIDSSLRISFGRYTTEEDILALSDSLHKHITLLRRFTIK